MFPAENPFTDNQYNHGLVARSALEPGSPLLVTSYLHWYFYDIDAVRAEDWHRSTYLLLLTEIRRLTGDTAVFLTKLVFIGIVFANIFLISLLAKRAHARSGYEPERFGLPVFFVLIFPVMVVNSWMPRLLAAEYLDDMPAALCGFLAATLLAQRGPRLTTCLALGFFMALAFSIKNLSLVFSAAFLLSIVVITAMEQKTGRIVKIMARATAYVTSYAFFLAPTLYWNMKDLGLLVPEQARLGLIGRLRSDSPDGEHDLYFLKPDLDLAHSWFDLTLENGLVGQLCEGLLLTLKAMQSGWVVLLVATFGLLGTWVARRRRRPTAVFQRLTVILVFSLLGLMGFFTLQLGEAGQLRYWTFPFGLGAALGVSGLITLFQAYKVTEILEATERFLPRKPHRHSKGALRQIRRPEPKSTLFRTRSISGLHRQFARARSSRQLSSARRFDSSGIANCLLAAMLLVVILNAVGQSAYPASTLWTKPKGYPEETTRRLAELAGSGAIMAHTNIGVNYWIDHPMTNIVGLGPKILVTLTEDQLAALVQRYSVRAAVYSDWERLGHVDKYKTISFLLANGFCEDSEFEGFVVLLWQGTDSRGGECTPQPQVSG